MGAVDLSMETKRWTPVDLFPLHSFLSALLSGGTSIPFPGIEWFIYEYESKNDIFLSA